MGKADQIIDDAIRKTANRTTGAGGDYGTTPQPMTGEEALIVARQAFNAYINEIGAPIEKDFAKVKETVEVLAGTRSKTSLAKSAVRFEDLRYLKQFPSVPPKSRYAGAAPTQAEFNALQEDVRKLYELLGSMAVIVGSRV